MATVEAQLPSGQTVTLRLFPLDSDIEATNVPMTEATNRLGTYTATVTGQSGNYHAVADVGGPVPLGGGYVWLRDDSDTYPTVEDRTQLARGEPGQGDLPLSIPGYLKDDFMYKGMRNRLVTSTATGETRLYADDSVTLDHKSAVSDNAGLKIRGKWQSGP